MFIVLWTDSNTRRLTFAVPRGIQPLLLIICLTVNLTRENCVRAYVSKVYLNNLLHSVQNGDLESLGRGAAFARTPPRADSAVLVCEPIYLYVASFRIKNIINLGTRRNNNIYSVKLEKF